MVNKLKENPLELLWKKEIKEGINKVAFAEGNIVVGTDNGLIKCFDLDGKLKWKYKIDSKPISIDISKEYIVTTSEEWELYLLDINGNLKWQRNNCAYSLISNNHILAGSKLFDINGNLKWKKDIPHLTQIDISDNYVAFATEGHHEYIKEPYVYLFNMQGELKWKCVLFDPAGPDVDMIKILDNNLIVATDALLHVFDLEGNLKSEYEADYGFSFRWIDVGDKNVVLGTDVVVCLLDERCNLKWQKIVGLDEFSNAGRYPAIYENYIFIGTYCGSLYVFDLDGNEIYKEKYEDEFGDDPLYFFRWDRYLLCPRYSDHIISLFKIKKNN